MIHSMQWAIIKKDLKVISSDKLILSSLFIVPAFLAGILPAIMLLAFTSSSDAMHDMQALINILPGAAQADNISVFMVSYLINFMMPSFFLMIPLLVSMVFAASSFVGEKEKRTLETLLYCPLPLVKIFQAKILASFFLGMAAAVVSFIVMFLVVGIISTITLGTTILPGLSWLVIMLMLTPAIAIIAITLVVRSSAKAQSVEEAQNRSVILIIPLIAILIAQFSGVISLNIWILLGAGVVFAVIAFVLLSGALSKFTYEKLLK